MDLRNVDKYASERFFKVDGDKVRALRKKKGLSQEALADGNGVAGWAVSLRTIIDIEKNIPPNERARETVENLAKTLGCAVSELIVADNARTPPFKGRPGSSGRSAILAQLTDYVYANHDSSAVLWVSASECMGLLPFVTGWPDDFGRPTIGRIKVRWLNEAVANQLIGLGLLAEDHVKNRLETLGKVSDYCGSKWSIKVDCLDWGRRLPPWHGFLFRDVIMHGQWVVNDAGMITLDGTRMSVAHRDDPSCTVFHDLEKLMLSGL